MSHRPNHPAKPTRPPTTEPAAVWKDAPADAPGYGGDTTDWLAVDDATLLAACEEDGYRASGPGGQHRNKTESAVRLRHVPTGVAVIAEERRSRHQNHDVAVGRLREAISFRVRRPVDRAAFHPPSWFSECRDKAGRLHLGAANPRVPRTVQLVLDVLAACEGRVSDAAGLLGLSTGNLSGFLTDDPGRLAAANRIRAEHALHPLRPRG